jgi:hypothetical protein
MQKGDGKVLKSLSVEEGDMFYMKRDQRMLRQLLKE